MTQKTMAMDMATDATLEQVNQPHVFCPENEQGNSKGQEDPKKSVEKHTTIRTVQFYKLFSFADRVDYLLMVVGTIAAAGNGLSMPMMTVIFGHLVNAFGGTMNIKQVVHEVSKVSLDFVYLALSSFAASFLQVACWVVTGERQAARIRRLYLKTILRQDMSFFDTQANNGEIVGQMSGGTVLIQDAIGEKVGKFIQLLSSFIAALIISFVKGWLLTLVMLSCVPLLVFSGALMSYVIAKVATRGQDAYSAAANVVEQTIGSIRTVVSFTGEKRAISRYNQSLTKAYKANVQEGLTSGLGIGTVMFIVCSSYSLAVWYGGKMVANKGYTAGDVITVSFAILTGSMSLGQASPCFSAFAAGQAAAYKMFEAIWRKSLIDVYDTEGRTLDDVHGVIELREVYFSYPSRPHEQILSGISLSIPSGTTAALVGQSGSGKSTVLSLIERFYDPQSGQVLIDGINLKEFQLKWIRQKIGLVSQEPVLFTSTIKENIAYGKDSATDEEILIAAELANAAKFVDKLPQGLDTMVGECGTQLSGGQKQRIAIARAILRDPRILLLDEATSALDAESEKVVQEALDRIKINRTTVIVAHRLRTIRNADVIAVIDQGKIVQKGSHEELTKNSDGAYSQLMRLQKISLTAKYSEENDFDRQEIARDSGRQSFHCFSVSKSISRESSGIGNSTHHSFSATSVVPNHVDDLEAAVAESSGPPSQPPPEVSLRRLASLNKTEIPILLMGTLAAGASGTVKPIFGLLIAKMIIVFYEPADELLKGSRFWALIFLALGVASLVLSPSRTYLFAVAGGKLIRRIRRMCFEKVIYMEVSWFDETNHSSGALGARLSTDAASLRVLVGDALGLLVQNIATAIAGLFIAFTANWQLALIVLFLLPLIAVNGYVQFESLKGFSADAKKLYEEASHAANDAVRSIRTVASFCAEEKVLNLYRKKCEGPIKAGIKQGLISGVGFGLSNLFQFAVYACSFYAGARLVEKGKTTISDVFEVYFALTLAAVGISQSSSLANDVTKTKNCAASIFSILDRKSKIDSSDESGMTPENIKGEVEFSHVTFNYPARPDVQVFRDLSLAIPSGKTVALVGESGSGKSTVISLLQRYYDPDSGVIRLDGVDIQKLQLKWLRQQMGLVSQEPVLFNDTIRANIAYGKEGNATEAEILEAAQLANAHKFISSLHKGYETIVGERGVQLSGGQKQRVAIARAIVKNPKILLLDEATSALDVESEKAVQDALDKAMVNRTTVVVAHRLLTIKGADIIALISDGAIAEKGNHESLLSIKGGIYESLVELHK